ncbi:unnamed protein product [Parnassius mnemosyne]|uniref:Integrase catalytic domain-containing protein n=1 Tax=Parnassius mnemosyne TaxID=213953 RepID=A0AAV1L478_9NEOP
MQYFAVEFENLKKRGRVSEKGGQASLCPFKDDQGILRVGGRLHKAELTQDMKHPILVPRESHLAQLIITEAHAKTMHGGPLLMINYIRTKYWIVNIKTLVKAYIRNCITCLRHSVRSNQPFMGNLPKSRVTPSKPFFQSGVDYAGPVLIRVSKGRGHHASKGYICLFVCMATRAIHLEAVSDLSAEGFLATFKRFVARRGHCADLWSDNGTNFVGAAKELKKLLNVERSTVAVEIAEWLATNGTNWHNIPPYAPNFGGLWEAGIKSTKFHLKRVIGNSTLTYEEITTVLTQIEAYFNSRPISQISDSIQDPYPLTPGHFLLGESLLLVPDANYENSNVSSLRRWQFTQRLVQNFWRRWSNEYLTQFLQRHKWRNSVCEPKIGDVVLVKEANLPPARWLHGIITEKHSGTDGVTRVVSLRCGNSQIKRPVSKLCLLPVTK